MKKYLLYLKSEPFVNILTVSRKRGVVGKSKRYQTSNFEPRKSPKLIIFPFDLSKFIYFLFAVPSIINAQPKFTPQYPFFSNDITTTINNSSLVNGAQLKNYLSKDKLEISNKYFYKDTTSVSFEQIAKNSDIVILDEINSPFETRVFTINSIPMLSKNNFTHVIMDIENDSSYFPERRKFPILPLNSRIIDKYGHLIREPLYASIVRTAKSNGLIITGLDSLISKTNRITIIQNQVIKIRESNPNSKVLIYLSTGDLSSEDISKMARNVALKKVRLSMISTSNFGEFISVKELEPQVFTKRNFYISLTDSLKINDKLIRRYKLIINANLFYENRPVIITRFIGRYFQNANRIKDQLHSCPCIVAAYRLEDLPYKERAVPYDLTHVDNLSEMALLSLNPGMYFIYAFNKNGELIINFFDFVNK